MTVVSPPPRGFTIDEYQGRLARLQAQMRRSELDGVFVTQPPNFRYFSGLDMQFWESPTRPWFLILPAEGPIRAVIPGIGAPELAKTWIDDIQSWPAPVPRDDGVSLLTSALGELPHRFGRIGAELGREQSLRMPVIEFERVREALRGQGREVVDASPEIWRVRMIKSEAEVDKIRHACQIASRAYARVPALVNLGDSEIEACRKLKIELLDQGADAVPFLPGVSGPGGLEQIVCGPTERAIGQGDVLFFDTGATFDGYFCDFDRNYAVGQIADDTASAQEAVWQATEAGIAAARPGATPEDLFQAMARVLEDAGSKGSNVGRLGHGLGLQLTEPPSHMPGDRTVIEEGMVLTIEPGMEFAPGRMLVHEENIVVRAGAPELLTTRAPRELPVIS